MVSRTNLRNNRLPLSTRRKSKTRVFQPLRSLTTQNIKTRLKARKQPVLRHRGRRRHRYLRHRHSRRKLWKKLVAFLQRQCACDPHLRSVVFLRSFHEWLDSNSAPSGDVTRKPPLSSVDTFYHSLEMVTRELLFSDCDLCQNHFPCARAR